MRHLGEVLGAGTRVAGGWCMGNSFGYPDRAGTRSFLAGVADALVRGGRWVVDAATVAEIVLPRLEPPGATRPGTRRSPCASGGRRAERTRGTG